MKITRLSCPLLLFLASITTTTIAQNNNNNNNGGGNKVSSTQQQQQSTQEPSPSATASQTQAKSTASPSQQNTSPTQTQAQSISSKGATPPPIISSTSTDGSSAASNTFSYPTTTQTGPPMPKLYPDYPSPTVPPTQGAPYLQKSNVPEGSFFIAVGAAIGILLASVIAWRGIVAWSLHRSVKKAAKDANNTDSKAILRPKAGGNAGAFYATGLGSALSLDHIGGAHTKSGGKPTPNSSLFFSPTAGAGNTADDRRSAYLPAGYYPTQNPSVTHFHTHTQSISSSRYNRNSGLIPSPPGSPLIPPSRGGMGGVAGGNGSGTLRASESKTSLSLPPQGRAPSAYLEDLFESHQQLPGSRI